MDSLFPSAGRTNAFFDSPAGGPLALPSIPGYDVQAILGRGGMGIVYRARHLKLNRDVALKMILTGSHASRQDHLRFVREAESVAALRHPNIVQIYEIGEVDGHPFYTMEYVGGGSLADRMAGTIQPVREAAKQTTSLAKAVQAAHACGIIHRDLKPGNILVDDEDVLKITDFGLARRLDQDSDLTDTGARLGTPSYMAPEQMAGDTSSLGPPVDVFALGALLYEMLTGRPPFRGESLSETERKLATEDPTPPSRCNPRVPRDLETICLKCLEKDPRNRYASAGELAADLDLVERLEAIGIRRAIALNASDPGWLPHVQAAREYEALFSRAGLGMMANDPGTVSLRISASDIKDPLIAALDDWAVCETDAARRNRILEAARLADTTAGAWEEQFRDPAKWTDRVELTRLAEAALDARPQVQQVRALGDRLAAAGLDATGFRARVQEAHVDSLLANLALAEAYRATRPEEAIRYDQAALAIRPASATAHNNLGVALANAGRSAEAIAHYKQSLSLDPMSAATHFNLGEACRTQTRQ